MDRSADQEDLPGAGEAASRDAVLENRRRPGRAQDVSPELLSLLRELDLSIQQDPSPALKRTDKAGSLDWVRVSFGFCVTLVMSLIIWAVVIVVFARSGLLV